MEEYDGKGYEPSTIQSFISCVDRRLKGNGYPVSIKVGVEFTKTNETKATKGFTKGK